MTKISEVRSIFDMLDTITSRTKSCHTLENASQTLVDILYSEFSQSIVLVRMFATVPYSQLPYTNRDFVTQMVKKTGTKFLLFDDTQVLSLLGTRGLELNWCDRRKSKGHIGFPLVSAAFVDMVPMFSKILEDVGYKLDGIERKDSVQMGTSMGTSRVFYAADAATATDSRGRLIINQEFTRQYGVKTVFGMASNYTISKTFLIMVAFCRESIDKSQVDKFLPVISQFKAGTSAVAVPEKVFG